MLLVLLIMASGGPEGQRSHVLPQPPQKYSCDPQLCNIINIVLCTYHDVLYFLDVLYYSQQAVPQSSE